MSDCAHGVPMALECGACKAEGTVSLYGVDATLAQRGSRYGDFTSHAAISQDLQAVMAGTPGWQRCDPVKREALTIIVHKIARILNGDPEYTDNWHDIQGYAKLAEDRCSA